MPAKLIFYNEGGEPEWFQFCPVVKTGCPCFLTKYGKCDGEYGESTAYRLTRHLEYSAYDFTLELIR